MQPVRLLNISGYLPEKIISDEGMIIYYIKFGVSQLINNHLIWNHGNCIETHISRRKFHEPLSAWARLRPHSNNLFKNQVPANHGNRPIKNVVARAVVDGALFAPIKFV
jgi:hypothetical protein